MLNTPNFLHACTLTLFAASALHSRTWTSTDGQTVEADFQSVRDGKVILKQDDKTLRINLAAFTQADKDWIKRYREIGKARAWTLKDGTVHEGRFEKLDGDKVTVKRGAELTEFSRRELQAADAEVLTELLTLLELEEAAIEESPTLDNTVTPAEVATTDQRDWVDAQGRRITASLVRVEGDVAILFFRNREWKFPIAKLSLADQQHLTALGYWTPPATPHEQMPDEQMIGEPPAEALAQTVPTEEPMAERPIPAEYDQRLQPPAEQPVLQPADAPVETPPAEPAAEVVAAEESYDEEDEFSDPDPVIAEYYRKTFKDGGQEVGGFAECFECGREFTCPVGFTQGDACPFCQKAVDEVLTTKELEEGLKEAFSGERERPWLSTRAKVRLTIFILCAVGGGMYKMFTGEG